MTTTAEIKIGTVVHFAGRRRRYVVVDVNRWGQLTLSALSGGDKGSGPTGHKPDEFEVDDDQIIEFSGAERHKRARDYRERLAMFAAMRRYEIHRLEQKLDRVRAASDAMRAAGIVS